MACYTVDEVEAHNNSNDCWVIFKGKVYNVTPFLEDHPGGQEIVLEHAGTDCTNAFEDVGHSESAYEMLKEFYIGEIVKFKEETSKDETLDYKSKIACCKTSISVNPKLKTQSFQIPVIGAALFIGAAIAYNAFFRK